jgi:hypothetical protein
LNEHSFAISKTIGPISFIGLSIAENFLSLAVSKTKFELPYKLVAKEIHLYPSSMRLSVLNLTFIKVSISFDESSNWPRDTLGPNSIVIVSIGKDAFATTVSLTILIPLAFVDLVVREFL